MEIFQGSNSAIILNLPNGYDSSNIQNIEVCMYGIDQTELKHWTMADTTISNGTIICPLSQAETIEFVVGMGKIEAKFLDDSEVVHMLDDVTVNVRPRKNHRTMGDAGTITSGVDHNGNYVSWQLLDDGDTLRLNITEGSDS